MSEEPWDGTERREHAKDRRDHIVTLENVADLARAVGGLQGTIKDLNERLDRQWYALKRKRVKMMTFVVIYTIVTMYAGALFTDWHVKNCMTFGSVQNEREKRICDITFPIHDHHYGGTSDERLMGEVDRVRRILEEADG